MNTCIYLPRFQVKQREAVISVVFICIVLNKMSIFIWPSVACSFDILLTFLCPRLYSRIRSFWAPSVPKQFSLLQLILKCHLSMRDGELRFMTGTLNFKCHQTPHTFVYCISAKVTAGLRGSSLFDLSMSNTTTGDASVLNICSDTVCWNVACGCCQRSN